MNKESLKEYLSSKYQGWRPFLDNVIFPIFGEEDFKNGYEAELLDSQPERKRLAEATGIRSIKQVGMMYVGVEPLQIFDVTVSDRVMMERNRVNIQRLIRAVMDQFSCAFMLFHYEDDTRWDWRFTYCRKSGSKEETTDSKRYTFLLGPGQSCRTAADNFMALYDKRASLEIKDIEEAFNVEALSKEFFEKYKAQYEAFVNYMVDPANGMRQDFIDTDFDHTGMAADKIRDREEKPIRDYVKKLLGRIVFLHFLQKKGWLGVPAGKQWGEGDRDFMLKLFKNATERQKENFLDDILEDLFAEGLDRNRSDKGDLYDTEVNGIGKCRIPYLNGGLFEQDDLDKKTVHFPASYFDSLLTMLSQYNFTIDENDPNDAEVGVDPEMLGRIFENLLEDNKDKGAFYTPKEIVQYMCRESLIAYLQTDQKEEDKERIRQFVTTHDAEVLGDLKEEIDQKLIDVKICDPAIGSGAFPMGLLRELFFCRSAIEPNIVESAANIKRHIIQNNIYGVDIERGAVDIARLRFWLSLIVDEKSPEALPNLDFKIMQGNSLLESYEGMDLSKLATMSDEQNYEPQRDLFGELENQQIKMVYTQRDKLKDFQTNLKLYFETTGHDERTRLRKAIDDYIRETIIFTLDTHKRGEEKKVEQIQYSATLNDRQKKVLAESEANISHLEEVIANVKDMELPNSQFFLWHTWFHDVFSRPSKEGFDIVIGNPPYVRRTSIPKADKFVYEKLYDSSTKQYDLYLLFIEMGLKILANNSYLCFINPIRFFNSDYGFGCRKHIIKNHRIKSVLDISQLPVFQNALTYPCVLMLQQGKCKGNNIEYKKMHNLKGIQSFIKADIITAQSQIELDEEFKFILDVKPDLRNLIAKINSKRISVSSLFDIARGLANNKVDFSGKEYLALKSTNVKRYYINGKLKNIDSEYGSIFEKEMIILPRTVEYLQAMIKPQNIVCLDRIYYLIPKQKLNLLFPLGILNCNLTNFWFEYYYKTTKVQGNYFDLNGNQIGSIPIPLATLAQQQPIIDLVDTILAKKRQDAQADTAAEEKTIDQLVYQLYDLTEEEIRLIENN